MASDVQTRATQQPDKRAQTNWAKAEIAYQYYVDYLLGKDDDKFKLSIVDLLYVMNFKGGSATITEAPKTLEAKLARYEQALRKAASMPEFGRPLRDLSDDEYKRARGWIVGFAAISDRSDARIKGFGESFASALLHFYFPNLVPILDKRALNGARLDHVMRCSKWDDSVENLLECYPALIDYFRDELQRDPTLSLRGLDRLLFEEELRRPPFREMPHRERG